MVEKKAIGKSVVEAPKKVVRPKIKPATEKQDVAEILHDIEDRAENEVDLTPQIAMRAYELYEQRGRQEGLSVQDWGQAEREIRQEINP